MYHLLILVKKQWRYCSEKELGSPITVHACMGFESACTSNHNLSGKKQRKKKQQKIKKTQCSKSSNFSLYSDYNLLILVKKMTEILLGERVGVFNTLHGICKCMYFQSKCQQKKKQNKNLFEEKNNNVQNVHSSPFTVMYNLLNLVKKQKSCCLEKELVFPITLQGI